MSSSKPDLRDFRDGDDPGKASRAWVEASQILSRRGDVEEARSLLRAAIQAEPGCAEAWLRLAWLSKDEQERKALLRQVLALDPENMQAGAELARLQRQPAQPATESRPDGGRVWRWALGVLVLAVVFLLAALVAWGLVDYSLAWLVAAPIPTGTPTPALTPGEIAAQFVPQLQVALSSEDWDRALEIIDIMEGLDPTGDGVQQWALTTHMQYGQVLVQAGQADQAQDQFDQAVAVAPRDGEASRWQLGTQHYRDGYAALEAGQWDLAIRFFMLAEEQVPDYHDVSARLAQAYRGWGLAALNEEDWTAAIEALSRAHERIPDDEQVAELLSWAYRRRGIGLQEEGKLKKARADLEAALDLRPDDAKAQAHLDEVMYILFPPKRIEIDISEQHFYAWLGDTLVYSFPTSTGLRGRDTATGHFEVLDKMPMAYSSVWNLSMPYWLGIYYVANIENGIHALPIRPDGSVMWGGLLGQRASYGCVILSTEAARLIYDWAEIGTPVHIHY